jgi:glycine betaine/proline transport system permease protein
MLGLETLSSQSIPWKRFIFWAAVLALGLALIFYAQTRPDLFAQFPESWNFGLRQPIDDFQSWVISNQNTHLLFQLFFDPLSAMIDTGLRAIENFLLALPWLVVVLAFGWAGYYFGGWRLGAICVGGLMFCGLTGLWAESMQTFALMAMSVLLSLLVGVPLGILSARNPTFESFLRPILDGMQTMPAYVYLIPVLLFFGVGRVPGVVATVIYALPPAIRLTSLGIRQVLPSAIEAARSFGSTPGQMLFKVELPLALPAIMTGVNQTIMMALGIVVIAALIGAGGLGKEVTASLQRLKVGDAFEAGMAIVFLAILLDRLSDAISQFDFTFVEGNYPQLPDILQLPARWLAQVMSRVRRQPDDEAMIESWRPYSFLILGALIVLSLVIVSRFTGVPEFPKAWNIHLNAPVDAAVDWMKIYLFEIPYCGRDAPPDCQPFTGTGPISDFITLYMMNPLRAMLTVVLPWPALILWTAALGFAAGGWRLGSLSGLGLLFIGFLGMWELAADTLSQVIVAIVFTVAIAVPLGILTSRSDATQRFLRPVLDTLQTIPPFVYLVPVIMLFNVGRVPGLIAAVLYALPPGIKLVDLGLRQVSAETVEAAKAFGSTEMQTLMKVKLPLALPAILVGVNQMIMMVLAMVIISGLVGGGGLGLEAVTGLARNETGRGIEAGLAIVAMAIVIDRITQAWAVER